MFIALAAVLSLAASLAIDVPYLPQTDALCGGAAAAMVLRYWGDARDRSARGRHRQRRVDVCGQRSGMAGWTRRRVA
jgi:hypothetical protein